MVNGESTIGLDTTVGCFSLLNSIKLVLIIGLLSTLSVSVFIIMYFRPAILAIILPIMVFSITLYGILHGKHFCLWPIIGISWFHIILTLYFDLFFIYFFIFKPNYIIMVLNWAFDTLYTKKTTSYFVQCTIVIALTTAFGSFNLWQLNVLMNFKRFLKRQKDDDQPSQIISIMIGQEKIC